MQDDFVWSFDFHEVVIDELGRAQKESFRVEIFWWVYLANPDFLLLAIVLFDADLQADVFFELDMLVKYACGGIERVAIGIGHIMYFYVFSVCIASNQRKPFASIDFRHLTYPTT